MALTYQGTIKNYRIRNDRISGVLQHSQRPQHDAHDETPVHTTPASIYEGVAITRSGSIYLLVEPAPT